MAPSSTTPATLEAARLSLLPIANHRDAAAIRAQRGTPDAPATEAPKATSVPT